MQGHPGYEDCPYNEDCSLCGIMLDMEKQRNKGLPPSSVSISFDNERKNISLSFDTAEER